MKYRISFLSSEGRRRVSREESLKNRVLERHLPCLKGVYNIKWKKTFHIYDKALYARKTRAYKISFSYNGCKQEILDSFKGHFYYSDLIIKEIKRVP